jgi:predicted lipoprotein
MASWQVAEILQLGPAGSPTMVMGGQGLRDEIYSWPTVNPCRVDQETVSEDYLDDGFFEDELVNTRGLAAIEYLLFDSNDENACAPAVDINANGSWQALVESGDLAERRAAYAARATAAVSRRAVELRDAWEPSGGDFAGQLSRAGLSGSQFSSAQDAINDLFAALFYLELEVKDRKLAIPAGLSPDCEASTCPEQSESVFADASKEHLVANLDAGERIFLCGDASAVGFDDFLAALGAEELAAEMLADIRGAEAAAAAIPGTFIDALSTDPQSVRDAYSALKLFTDDLKSQFLTLLALEIPDDVGSDND